jgi:hypothetical protein
VPSATTLDPECNLPVYFVQAELQTSEQATKAKLDEKEEENSNLTKELEDVKTLAAETKQDLEGKTVELQDAHAKAVKMDSELSGMHETLKTMSSEHQLEIQRVKQDSENAVKQCLSTLTGERQKHESTPAFQSTQQTLQPSLEDDIPEQEDDFMEQEDDDDNSQADQDAQEFLTSSQRARGSAVYTRKPRQQPRQQPQPQPQPQQKPKSILKVGSNAQKNDSQMEDSEADESGMETAIEQRSKLLCWLLLMCIIALLLQRQ